MPRRKKPEVELPVSDKAEITQTTVYPTIQAMWAEFTNYLWVKEYSPSTQRVLRFVFYAGISEALRTVAFRMNTEQADTVFGDFDKELRAFDLELQLYAAEVEKADAELH